MTEVSQASVISKPASATTEYKSLSKFKIKTSSPLGLPLFLDPKDLDKDLDQAVANKKRILRTKEMQEAYRRNPEKFNAWQKRIDRFYKRAVWGAPPKKEYSGTSSKSIFGKNTEEKGNLAPLPSLTLWHYSYYDGKTRAERRSENLKRLDEMKQERVERRKARHREHRSRISKFARKAIERRESEALKKKQMVEEKEVDAITEEQELDAQHEAATAIQARFRGQQSRKRKSISASKLDVPKNSVESHEENLVEADAPSSQPGLRMSEHQDTKSNEKIESKKVEDHQKEDNESKPTESTNCLLSEKTNELEKNKNSTNAETNTTDTSEEAKNSKSQNHEEKTSDSKTESEEKLKKNKADQLSPPQTFDNTENEKEINHEDPTDHIDESSQKETISSAVVSEPKDDGMINEHLLKPKPNVAKLPDAPKEESKTNSLLKPKPNVEKLPFTKSSLPKIPPLSQTPVPEPTSGSIPATQKPEKSIHKVPPKPTLPEAPASSKSLSPPSIEKQQNTTATLPKAPVTSKPLNPPSIEKQPNISVIHRAPPKPVKPSTPKNSDVSSKLGIESGEDLNKVTKEENGNKCPSPSPNKS